jgi:hypothetical protein
VSSHAIRNVVSQSMPLWFPPMLPFQPRSTCGSAFIHPSIHPFIDRVFVAMRTPWPNKPFLTPMEVTNLLFNCNPSNKNTNDDGFPSFLWTPTPIHCFERTQKKKKEPRVLTVLFLCLFPHRLILARLLQ